MLSAGLKDMAQPALSSLCIQVLPSLLRQLYWPHRAPCGPWETEKRVLVWCALVTAPHFPCLQRAPNQGLAARLLQQTPFNAGSAEGVPQSSLAIRYLPPPGTLGSLTQGSLGLPHRPASPLNTCPDPFPRDILIPGWRPELAKSAVNGPSRAVRAAPRLLP
ncbi:hypothetical protein KIL84_011588 [Mauremys mutica]|uniref:Uncharacterized protein n=1 Tax=Mauremys mutica TaxID=74926 RepID=A0A9D4B2G0_9SAUR|nr:hypothetical protein KIL84_011588 [Mauremys mutica]